MTIAKGGCLCGAVRFETNAPLRDVLYCHCGQCRKQTGLYYAATGVPWSHLNVTDAGALRWFAASSFAKRGFCGTCGSALFWKPNDGDHVAVLAGAFDDGTPLTPGYHVFTEDKGSYYHITDDLPQYARGSEGLAVDGA